MGAPRSYDFVIVGSGFGGSVSAMRLAEKGYSVAVIEAGKRWRTQDFPESNWNLPKYLWAPLLRFFGPQRITLLKGVMVLRGAGVGGGSLVYANTLMSPRGDVFRDGSWPMGRDWESELAPHYAEARRMLGVATTPMMGDADRALQLLGERMGIQDSFHPTEVGVFFGEPGKTVPDPYFGGKGPERAGCLFCGGCMVGCRHNAKNSLDKNYLYFAERAGAEIFPERIVTRIAPWEEGGYRVDTRISTSWRARQGESFVAGKVVLAAGVLGTVEILLRNRDRFGTLRNLSPRLGERVRTNGESLLGATSFDAHRDFSRGVAIGSAIHPDERTKIEPVRYPPGSSALRFLAVPLTPDGTLLTRPVKLLWSTLRRFPRVLRLWWLRDWARRSVILLVMQTVDRQMRLRLGRSILGSAIRGAATDKPIPSYLPIGQQAVSLLAEEIAGEPQNCVSEVMLGTPATAHILGGCCLGDDATSGVVDENHEVFGHLGLYVCDGSVVPSNLGVNPSLTITALAERFASRFPPKKAR